MLFRKKVRVGLVSTGPLALQRGGGHCPDRVTTEVALDVNERLS